MMLYHCTPAPDSILASGFRDSDGYVDEGLPVGVFFSDRPLDGNEGAKGDHVLEIEMPDEAVGQYECISEGLPYREFIIPAAVVAKYWPPRLMTSAEVEAFEDDRFRPVR